MNIKPITTQATPIRNQNGQVTRNFQNPSFGISPKLPQQCTRRGFLVGLGAFLTGVASSEAVRGVIQLGKNAQTVANNNLRNVQKSMQCHTVAKVLERIGIGRSEELIKAMKKTLPEWTKVYEDAEKIAIKFAPKDSFATFELDKLNQVLALRDGAILSRNPRLTEALNERLTDKFEFIKGDSITLRRKDIGASIERFFDYYTQHSEVFPAKLPSKGTAQHYKNILEEFSSNDQLKLAIEAFQKLGWEKEESGNIVKLSRNKIGEPVETGDVFALFDYPLNYKPTTDNAMKKSALRHGIKTPIEDFEIDKSKAIKNYESEQGNLSPALSLRRSPIDVLAQMYEKINLLKLFPTEV